MIDRLVHHAEILSLKGDSYRLRDKDLGHPPAAQLKPSLPLRCALRAPLRGSEDNTPKGGSLFQPAKGGDFSTGLDMEEVFEEPIASKSTVSRICEDTRERYRQWCRRRLEQHDIIYLFLDAIYLKLRPDDQPSEGVLVCWGVTLEGRKVLLGLALGSRESYDSWLAFGRDMIGRGLRAPALVIADGATRYPEGRPRALARRSGAALHRPCAAERDEQAA
jgi:hypothetical protein